MGSVEEYVAGLDDLPVRDTRLRALLKYWLDIRDGCAVPDKRRFDPVSVPNLLPYIFLWSYDWRSGDLLFRLAGEHILNMFGREPKPGMALEDCFPGNAGEPARRHFLIVVNEKSIMHLQWKVRTDEGTALSSERLILPLSDDGDVPTHVVGATLYSTGRKESRSGTYLSEHSHARICPVP